MKRRIKAFVGSRPVFSGSPSIVQGGFNLDREAQNFVVGDVIPAGTLAIYDEEKRTVNVIKTAKVTSVGSSDKKVVSLFVGEFYEPIFAVGDKVAKAGAISGTFASAVSITKIEKTENTCVITLSGEITGLKKDDVLVQVVEKSSNASEIGEANAVTIADVVVGEYETSVDISADTMQYALFERRVPPIPASQKNEMGSALKANPHVKLSKSL